MSLKLASLSKKIAVFISVVILFFVFQNCGKKHMSVESTDLASLDTGIIVVEDPEEEPLTSDDPIARKVQVNQLVANRILVANYFVAIFGSKITNYVTTAIAEQPNDFGSANTIYDRVIASNCTTAKNIYSPCATNVPLSVSASDNIGVSVRREAFRLRSCHYGVKNLTIEALKKIDSKATNTKPPAITYGNISKAFQLFYRGRRPATTEVLESLMIVSQNKSKPLDRWKDVLLTVCLSPHWQVL